MAVIDHIVAKSLMARNGYFGVLSTGEKLAAAFVLNRPDLLEKAGYTMAEAICRLESEWLAVIPAAARYIDENY